MIEHAQFCGGHVFSDMLHALSVLPSERPHRERSRPEGAVESGLLTARALRLRLMERLLREGGVVSSRRLLALTGASIATFKRDLDALRYEFGAEVVYLADEYGYRLLNPSEFEGVVHKVLDEINRV